MEGKPTIPGLGGEHQPNPVESVPSVVSQELGNAGEILPEINSRTTEVAPPPALATPEATLAQPEPAQELFKELPTLTDADIKTHPNKQIEDILAVRFDSQLES